MKKEKLHIIAPILSEISLKKNAFKVPDNYFGTIEDDVVATINLQNLLSKNSTSNFKAPNNYFDTIEEITITKLKAEVIQTKEKSQLPDGYFDTFEDLVLTKIKKNEKVISIKRIAKYFAPLAIAASLLLIFVLKTNQKTVTFDSLATTEIEQFVESGLIDINIENLAIAFSDVEFPTKNITTSISDEEVLAYLTIEDLETIIYED